MAVPKIRNPPLTRSARYTIEASAPINDKIFSAAALVNHLQSHMKVNEKVGPKSAEVAVRAADTKVLIAANVAISKRYCKYLIKRFLKKNGLTDYIRIIATDKNTYKIKYINMTRSD